MKCVYHSNCYDGFAAAFLVKLKYPDCELVPGVYNRPPPSIIPGEAVYIVDFSYPPEVMDSAFKDAGEVWVLDHHHTAIQATLAYYAERAIPANTHYVFEYDSSGAGVVWNHLFSREEKQTLIKQGGCWSACALTSLRPLWVDHVQNRDLWRFDDPDQDHYPQLGDTKQFMEAMGGLDFDHRIWAEFLTRPYAEVMAAGRVLMDYRYNLIKRHLQIPSLDFTWGGFKGVWVNAPYYLASDLADALKDDYDLQAIYSDEGLIRKVSLRSKNGVGPNISVLAKQLNGGGHPHAAGFETTLDFSMVEYTSSLE